MGRTWRRSASVEPLRFNLSSAGGGTSVGLREARLSVGPRGTYIRVGAGGFRYTQQRGRPVVDARRTRSNLPSAPTKPATNDDGQTVESLDPAYLVDSTADELLDEIRQKHEMMSLVPLAVGVSAVSLIVFAGALFGNASPFMTSGPFVIGLLGLFALPWAAWHDRRARLVRLHYIFDSPGNTVQEGLTRLHVALERAHTIWAVHDEHYHGDWKRNAGAGTSVARRRVRVGWGGAFFH